VRRQALKGAALPLPHLNLPLSFAIFLIFDLLLSEIINLFISYVILNYEIVACDNSYIYLCNYAELLHVKLLQILIFRQISPSLP
jgi:hypothetical protein